MSISLPGKLRVKRLNGANGPFCVGDLETEIGDFRVKDAILDQFDEGLYEGQFCIQQIFPWSYTAYGRMVIEIRAKLADLQIDGHTRAGAERDSVEPDPAKESPVESAVPAPAPAAPPADPVTASPAVPIDAEQDTPKLRAPRTPAKPPVDTNNEADQALFGDDLFGAVAERQPVKLDPTIDRIQFRLQRDRLKALDYTFHAGSQSWMFSA